MENGEKVENVVIIGGGPAGLAASIYNARANLNPLVFGGSPYGGQLMLTSDVENYPGYESILGPELVEKWRGHAKKFGVRIIDQNVVKVDFSQKPFKVSTATTTHLARSVIIATGAKALWLGLDSETRLRGKGVSACATCDGFFFKNKTVGVVGGGDTAMEEALTLVKFAKKVYIIHRKNTFRASKIMQDRVLSHPQIEVIWNAAIEEVVGENKVEGVKLKTIDQRPQTVDQRQETTDRRPQTVDHRLETIDKGLESKVYNLDIDGLFIAIGHKPDTGLFTQQVELDAKGYVITLERAYEEAVKKMINNQNPNSKENLKIGNWDLIENWKLGFGNYRSMTSVPGVFAAGDNVDHMYRQAATAVGMGVAAALEVERWLEVSS
ncbi:MAG: FAD-dependent oxidoreductase [bacterium]|nr:FAD-dependent oxidoreductase [bacterium]